MNKSQKIVFFYQYAYSKVGGIQNFNKTFIKALEEISDFDSLKEINLIGIYDKKRDVTSKLKGFFFSGSKIKLFLHIINSFYSYDIFIVSHINLAVVGLFIKLLNPRCKLIFCTHGIEVWRDLPFLTKYTMSKSLVLTVSTFSKSQLLKFNSKLKRIEIFPNSIDIIKKKNLLNPYKKKDYFNLLSVCRLDTSEKEKGIDSTIKALSKLDKTLKINYYIIGKGNDTIRLKKIVADCGLENKVFFLGYVDDLTSYYQYCNFFVMPSKKEGFGIVYLEAMLYKKPVIACNYGGVTDVVINNETGILTNYNDVNFISKSIIELINNQEISRKYGEKGYERLIQNFTFAHYLKRLDTILRKL